MGKLNRGAFPEFEGKQCNVKKGLQSILGYNCRKVSCLFNEKLAGYLAEQTKDPQITLPV